jgi:polyribonucleotide nucleotidyltransferase
VEQTTLVRELAVTNGEWGITNLNAIDKFYPDMKRISFALGGKTVTVETGRVARSAGGAVWLQCGETVIMATATASESVRPGIDFFPLLVDYEEKMYSVGRLPGGYNKREGRPSEKAILISRLIDRPIRPLFPDGYRNDVQLSVAPLVSDSVEQNDVLAMLAASFALTLCKGVPFMGPIGAVRVGRINGELKLNLTHDEQALSDLNLIVSGTRDSIMMVEAEANFVSEATLIEALAFAQEAIVIQVDAQEALAKQCGLTLPVAFVPAFDNAPVVSFVKEQALSMVEEAFHTTDREARQALLKAAKEKAKVALGALAEDHAVKQLIASQDIDVFAESFKKVEKTVMRSMVLNEGVRADGRGATDIRPIKCHVGVLPRVHGSALFTRGSTQVVSVCTLGAPGDAQALDGVDPVKEKRWMHHYNFPAFSVGEVRPNRGPGRREIGHGALAERAVAASLPEKNVFSYTIRVNSDVVESNGSTSMASTCGATLALMDAGVPLKEIVGGIAMGLIKENNKAVILSDIQGVEDFLGDMDFKVTGNRSGVTALQMDIKIQGISVALMQEALEQARQGRIYILNKMAEAIEEPRQELSSSAPRILNVKIDTDQIGAVIGPGGKMIRSIIEETGATIDIEDDGNVIITSSDAGGERARDIILELTKKIIPGEYYKGRVVNIIPIGAFVELAKGKEGMVHISQFPVRVPSVDAIVAVGDELVVKVVDVDDRGRINLSMREVTDEQRAEFGLPPFVVPEFPEPPEGGYSSGGGYGDRGDRGSRPPRRDGGGYGDRGDRGSRPPRRDGGGYGDRDRGPRY